MAQDEEKGIESLLADAEETSQEFSEAQKQIRKVKVQLRRRIKQLQSQDEISESEAREIRGLIAGARYGEARKRLQQIQKSLEFDNDEKQEFAERFKQDWKKLEGVVEQIRNSLAELADGPSKQDQIALLYGKHNLRKTDIRKVYDAISNVEDTSIDTDVMARLLAAIKHDLNITAARDVLKKIKEES